MYLTVVAVRYIPRALNLKHAVFHLTELLILSRVLHFVLYQDFVNTCVSIC